MLINFIMYANNDNNISPTVYFNMRPITFNLWLLNQNYEDTTCGILYTYHSTKSFPIINMEAMVTHIDFLILQLIMSKRKCIY